MARNKFKVVLFGKKTTGSGKYSVNYGRTKNSFNRNERTFRLKKNAVAFANAKGKRYGVRPRYVRD